MSLDSIVFNVMDLMSTLAMYLTRPSLLLNLDLPMCFEGHPLKPQSELEVYLVSHDNKVLQCI